MIAPVGDQRLRVLFFAQRFPYPMDSGGKIRTAKLLEELGRVFAVTFIANVEHPTDDPYLEHAERICTKFIPVPWREVAKGSMAFYGRIARRLWSRYPIAVLNDYSPALESALLAELAQKHYDLVVCDFLQPSLNLRRVKGCPTILFQHNVEAVILERHQRTAGSPLMKLFWRNQWRKMYRYEKAACRRFDAVVAVSDVDREVMEREYGLRHVYSIPTGVDTEYFRPWPGPEIPNSLVFTGSMDWLPNEDALTFFAQEILGRIKAKIPNVSLAVVGRKPSNRLLALLASYPEISVIGRVDDVRPYIARHAVYIIPLRIGGGTRIKFYEAMAMGKAVVSTRIGAEGLPVTHGENVVLADGAEGFAKAVVELLGDDKARDRLQTASREFVERHCSWAGAAAAFADVCRRVAPAGIASPGSGLGDVPGRLGSGGGWRSMVGRASSR